MSILTSLLGSDQMFLQRSLASRCQKQLGNRIRVIDLSVGQWPVTEHCDCATSIFGLSTILWSDRNCHTPPIPPCDLQRSYMGKYSVHIWQVGWMSQTASPTQKVSKGHLGQIQCAHMALNLVQCGNKRQRGVDFAPQLPQHCFWLGFCLPKAKPTLVPRRSRKKQGFLCVGDKSGKKIQVSCFVWKFTFFGQWNSTPLKPHQTSLASVLDLHVHVHKQLNLTVGR